MNVSSVSSMPVAVGRNLDVAQLERQIQGLLRQIEAVNQSNADAKTKAEEVTLLEQQIQMIEMEIQQQQRLQAANSQLPQPAPAASAQSSANLLNTLA